MRRECEFKGNRHARAMMHVGIANPQWRVKHSRHSRRMHIPQKYVSGKRPMWLDPFRIGYVSIHFSEELATDPSMLWKAITLTGVDIGTDEHTEHQTQMVAMAFWQERVMSK